MNEPVDYKKVLDELVAEREKLDMMISWVKLRLGQPKIEGKPLVATIVKVGEPMRVTGISSDAFFRMNVSEAIKAYLEFAKKPQTAREITDALKEGGLAFKAKNLYQTVFPTLSRMEGAGQVAKLKDGRWGLSDWYSSARRQIADSSSENENQ